MWVSAGLTRKCSPRQVKQASAMLRPPTRSSRCRTLVIVRSFLSVLLLAHPARPRERERGWIKHVARCYRALCRVCMLACQYPALLPRGIGGGRRRSRPPTPQESSLPPNLSTTFYIPGERGAVLIQVTDTSVTRISDAALRSHQGASKPLLCCDLQHALRDVGRS